MLIIYLKLDFTKIKQLTHHHHRLSVSRCPLLDKKQWGELSISTMLGKRISAKYSGGNYCPSPGVILYQLYCTGGDAKEYS